MNRRHEPGRRRPANGALLFLALALSAAPLDAQEPDPAERAAVLEAVEVFFASMTARDADAAREVLEPRGRFFSIRQGDDGPTVGTFGISDYIDGLADGTTRQVERIWDPVVRIHGDLANVWAPYDFHIDGALSHCGVDSFDLIRVDGRWRISGGAYTVERTGCDGDARRPGVEPT
jgi:hypothetical protein